MFDKKKFADIIEGTEFESVDVDYIEAGCEDELREALQEWICERDIVYYNCAMRYLMENDPSLSESMELAAEYGQPLDKINSEYLATLLYQKNLAERLTSMDLEACFSQD